MRELRGRVAAITGAGSGIGAALALRLAGEGCALSISDIDEGGLAETRERCEARGVRVHAERLDVSDRDAVFGWADDVVRTHGAAHLIVNNAGTTLGASVRHMTIEEFEWLMGINFWGVVYGTKAFLPYFEQAGAGHVVNISSVFGFIAFPGQSAYNATKFGVRGFTEALAIELDMERSPVQVSCVHPGGIRTNIARRARVGSKEPVVLDEDERNQSFERLARTTPERAAEVIVDGILRNKRRILIGRDASLISAVSRLLPVGYQRLLARIARNRQPGVL